ncbi:MAG: response regulator [Chthoniobacterales bacterium]
MIPRTPPPSLAAPCLLIIDDDDSVREVFRCILRRHYRIIEASGVDEALLLIDRECPDLVTLDIRMPGKDGLEGLRLLRERNENLPVVVITGFGSNDTACEAVQLGASGYLKKPCGPTQLLATIHNHLRKSQRYHHPGSSTKGHHSGLRAV